MQFPFDFLFSTPTSMCSRLTQIAVPPWRIFPFHPGWRLFTIDIVLHFSNAVKCSTKAQRHSDMIDRSFVKPADAIYLEEDGGLQQYDFSSMWEFTHAGNQAARKLSFPEKTKCIWPRVYFQFLFVCVYIYIYICVNCKSWIVNLSILLKKILANFWNSLHVENYLHPISMVNIQGKDF